MDTQDIYTKIHTRTISDPFWKNQYEGFEKIKASELRKLLKHIEKLEGIKVDKIGAARVRGQVLRQRVCANPTCGNPFLGIGKARFCVTECCTKFWNGKNYRERKKLRQWSKDTKAKGLDPVQEVIEGRGPEFVYRRSN